MKRKKEEGELREGRGEKRKEGKGEGKSYIKKGEREKKNRVPQQGSNPRPSTLQPTAYGYRLEGRFARTYYTCIYRKFRF